MGRKEKGNRIQPNRPMKKIFLVLTACLSLAGTKAQETNQPMKILVACFSYSGNARTVAEQIRKATGADFFGIEVRDAYPSDYQGVLDRAKREIGNDEKPALKAMPENLAAYDVIFTGSPNWWNTIAPPVAAFLSSGDFTGNTLVPFVTHGGGGMAHCETAVKRLCPTATLLKGLAVNGSSVAAAAPRVERWLKEIGVGK